jgi:subtilisin family serine protease
MGVTSTIARRSRIVVGVMALGLAAAPLAAAAPVAQSSPQGDQAIRMNYVVNTAKGKAAIKAAKKAIKKEGGVVLSTYKKISVITAQSSEAKFAKNLRKKHSDVVKSAGATRTAEAPPAKTGLDNPNRKAVALDPDPREGEQWGNTMLQSLEANEHQPGSKDVLVGVLDSGVDTTHPDLVANFDKKNSVSCIDNGIPDTSANAWMPTSSTHGTHVAGTIAAARDGQGVAGIAPEVSYASIKVVNDDGYIYPEYALCGFMWAASHGVDVTNNSYYVDPWMWWCKYDKDQGAIQQAFKKMMKYVGKKKDIVTVVAAGNSGLDLTKVTSDSTSPNDGTPFTRKINKKCTQLPGQLNGNVVQVSSVTSTGAKSSFSNYGLGQIAVAAPGSSILSTTWPGHGWGFLSGTSMASPHVAGVVALIRSEYPNADAAEAIQILEDTAVPHACPDGVAACEGDTDYNGYYGHGIVNALNAVS